MDRKVSIMGGIMMLLTPALLCHKDTVQGTQSFVMKYLSLCLHGIRAPVIYPFHSMYEQVDDTSIERFNQSEQSIWRYLDQ